MFNFGSISSISNLTEGAFHLTLDKHSQTKHFPSGECAYECRFYLTCTILIKSRPIPQLYGYGVTAMDVAPLRKIRIMFELLFVN